MKQLILLILLATSLLLVGCGGTETAVADPPVLPAVVVADKELSADTELNLEPSISAVTLAEIMDRDDVFVIDVREQWEYDEKHIPGVTLIPLGTIPTSLSQIPTDKTVVLTCRSGNRSGQAADFLRAQGFTNVHNMEGGILAWEAAGLPVDK